MGWGWGQGKLSFLPLYESSFLQEQVIPLGYNIPFPKESLL